MNPSRLRVFAIPILLAVLAGGVAASSEPTPGEAGEVRTTLHGSTVERLPVVYLGALRGSLGPGIDLHLVELTGPVAETTGIASGMSGSPVYFDGRLFGALGYRLGTIPRRAIGGVVRIEDMEAAGIVAPSFASETIAPIATPITLVGAVGPEASWLEAALREAGLAVAPAGGGSATTPAAPLEPGSPVGVELARGDLRVAATGTLTRIENGTVHAFGHSFLGVGRVEFPLVAAEVVHVLEDMAGSTKITNLGAEVGAVLDDRVTSVVGRLDVRARMIPVRIEIDGASFDDTVRRYELVDSPMLTPLLLGAATSNALLGGVEREVEQTLRVRGRIALEGLPDVPVDLALAAQPGMDPGGVAAGAVQKLASALYANPFRKPPVREVLLRVQAEADARRFVVERLLYDRGPVRPGSEIEIVCVLRGYREARRRVTLRVRVPADVSSGSRLAVAVGGPDALETNRGKPLAARLADAPDLKTWLGVLADQSAPNVLGAELVRAGRGLVAEGRELDELPGTAARLLASGLTGRARRLAAEVLDRDRVELSGPVLGGLRARFVVDGEAGEEEDE